MRFALTLVLVVAATVGAANADWPVFGRDPSHSGVATDSTITTQNVAGLRKRWHIQLDAPADTAPVAGGSMVFLTTKTGTTYGIDAQTGHIVWRYATHGPNITTASPAFDSSDGSLYTPGVDGFVHKLDARTGAERTGGGFPARITLAPTTEKLASPLNLANGYVYANVSAYLGDRPPYVGHVVAIRLSDGSVHAFNALCSERHVVINPHACRQQGAGIWGRSGVVVDPDPSMHGDIFVATGNGSFNAQNGGVDYGNAVVAITSDASRVLGFFAPVNYAALTSTDMDIGSTSPAILPRQHGSATPLLLVQGGKDGILRLLDRTHLGGVGGMLQSVSLGDGVYSAPAVWNDSHGQTWLFVGLPSSVRAFRVVTSGGKSRLTSAWNASTNGVQSRLEGSSPAVSNGVVFVATNNELVALNATNGRRLWSSARSSAGGSIGRIHWQSPIVAGGMVFVSDQSALLTAYGL